MNTILPTKKIETVVFDLGGVLIDWDPRNLYRKMFDDEKEMEYFLENVCTMEWNIQQDAGRSCQEAIDILTEQFPQYKETIAAYYHRWEESLGGAKTETVEVLKQFKEQGVILYALTNWSQETFPRALELFEFLHWFEGIVVSGEVKMIKPNPEIYRYLVQKYDIAAQTALFIDDNLKNVEAARNLGMQAIHFQNIAQVKVDLAEYNIISKNG